MFLWLLLEMYSRKFRLRLRGKCGNLRRLRRAAEANTRAAHSTALRAGSVLPRQSTRRYRSSFLRDELSAGSLGCGNDLVEALITAQRIPARIKAEIAVSRTSRELRDNFEFLQRAVAREASSEIVNLAVALAQQDIAQRHGKLLVNGRRLGFGKKSLKAWIFADRIPDGIDFQPRNGDD